MAGHGDSGASGKKSSEAMNDVPTFSAEWLQSNMKVIYYSRTFLSIIGGVIAGILGFMGLTGFILYFLNCYGSHFRGTHSQGKVFRSFILQLLEQGYTGWLYQWADAVHAVLDISFP